MVDLALITLPLSRFAISSTEPLKGMFTVAILLTLSQP